MPRIYDNLSAPTQLGAGLNEFLRSFTAIDVATGYFDLRGWSELNELITAKAGERKDGDRAVARARAMRIREDRVAHLTRQLSRGISTAEQRTTLHSLRALVKDGHVELRVYASGNNFSSDVFPYHV